MVTMKEKTAVFCCQDWLPFSPLVPSQHLSAWTRIVTENQECKTEVRLRKKSGKVHKIFEKKKELKGKK